MNRRPTRLSALACVVGGVAVSALLAVGVIPANPELGFGAAATAALGVAVLHIVRPGGAR